MTTLTIRGRERLQLLANLTAAEKALRENLHLHGLDPLAREHLERAVTHIREGYIAVNESGQARTVEQLTGDLTKVEQLVCRLAQRAGQSGVATNTTG